MKKQISLFFVLFSITFFNQQAQAQEHKWELGLQYTPGLTNMVFLSSANNSYNRFDDMSWKYGYSAGITAKYNFQEHWGVDMGLSFSNKGYKTDLILTDVNGDVMGTKPLYYYEKFIEIPLEFVYQKSKDSFQYGVALGLVPGYLVKEGYESDSYTINRNLTSYGISDKIVLGSQLKLNIGYQINKQWLIIFSPSGYYSFGRPFSSRGDNTIHHLFLGLGLTTSYCF